MADQYVVRVALETAVQLAVESHDNPALDGHEAGATGALAELRRKVAALARCLAHLIDDPHHGEDGQRELREFRAALVQVIPPNR
jgi:uncharacterized protein with von Willebrand factor type A (vWA) domain